VEKAVVQKYLTIDIVPLGIIIQDKKEEEWRNGVTHEKRSQDTILLFPEKPFF